MQFFKKFFSSEDIIIGLSALKKKTEYIRINIPESYKKSSIQSIKNNYILL